MRKSPTTPKQSATARRGPWICKQRAAGDWVVDQLDRETMRVSRFGPYQAEAEARRVYADLTR